MNKESFFQALEIIFYLILFIWVIEVINIILGHQLYIWGILPRDFESLPGIILHPFIHGSLQHAILNTLPLIVLGAFVAFEGRVTFIKVTSIIILIGGLLLWLFGRPSYHVGASLLIFGYFGFLLSLAFYRKTVSSIIIAGVTVFMYGGLIYGLVPMNNQISWEGHLFGLVAGIFGARWVEYEK